MEKKISSQTFTIALFLALTSVAAISQPSYAGGTKFYCAAKGGQYFTFASTEDGGKSKVIGWTSTDFPKPYDPKYRCQEVSPRFQRNYNNGTLKTIATGIVNGQPVICSGSDSSTVCNSGNLLFTLKPGANRKAVANRLFNRKDLATDNILTQNSNFDDIMFDFDIFLQNLQSEQK
ncbi:MAG: hypothetical protein HEQ10_17790 [Dolichospermum sp. DEX182a]|nr:hypothetical protein [Dolichospermum sp. DEX182a]QSV63244.1 MAG: hypothetical protein HEQ26_11335 [Dolichospermum sp. DL01]